MIKLYIRVYDEQRIEKDLCVKKQPCEKCGNFSYFHLYKEKNVVSILFFKIFSRTNNHLLVCDNCKSAYKIDKTTYTDLKKKQLEKINAGTVDKEIILSDFSPKETQFFKKKLKYILSIIWLVLFIMGTIGMISDIAKEGNLDASVPIGAVIMLSIGILPFIFSFKTYRLAKKQNKLYVNLSAYESSHYTESKNYTGVSHVLFRCPKCGLTWEQHGNDLSDIHPHHCRNCGYKL